MMSLCKSGILLLYIAAQLHSQPYNTVYPDYEPVTYTGVFGLGNSVYRVGLDNIIDVSTDEGESWVSLTPSVSQFNIIAVSASDTCVAALLSPTRWAPENWEDSLHTTILLFTKSNINPKLLQVPWFVPVTEPFRRKLYCSVTRDAIFLLEGFSESALIRSTDLGQSWEEIPLPDSLIESNVSLIKFYDKRNGMLIASVMNQSEKAVFVTQDEGRNWRRVPVNFALPGNEFTFRIPPICWLTKDSVLIADNNNATQLSTDGGMTWSVQSNNFTLPRITDLAIGRDNTGYIICGGGVLAKTSDCGRTYQIIREAQFYPGGGGRPVTYVYSNDNGRIVLVDDYGSVSTSSDRGVSWIDQKFQDYWQPDRLQMFSMDTVFAKVLPAHFYSSYDWYIRTTDGGATWNPCLDMSDADWADVYFATQTVWYAIRYPTELDSTVVAKSTDAGGTWRSIYKNSMINLIGIPRGRCSFGSDNFWFGTRKFLLATSDGGEHWSEISPGAGYRIPDQLELIDPQHCHILTSAGYMNTTDGGHTWRRHPETDQYWSDRIMAVNDGKRIYVSAHDIDLGCTRMWKSMDGGETWDTLNVHQDRFIRFAFISENGNSVGVRNGGEQFVSTKDEWRSYDVEYGRYSEGVWFPFFINQKEGYVTASRSILKTTTGGINWTNVTPSIPQSLRILSTWPQPVSQGGMMSTEVELTRPGPVKIELYDLLGRQRAVVLDTEVSATRRTVQWSTAGLERGVYVLRMVTGSGVANAKIVVE